MPVWRCPHCATPQSESSRCWVCRRSTTSCATCRHYRRGVAGGLGMCGLDPKRTALTGTEMRPCWVAAPMPADPPAGGPVAVGPGRAGREPLPAAGPSRTFVPVATASDPSPLAADETRMGTTELVLARAATISPAPGTPGRIPGTWWLWGDPEPWPDS